MIYPCPPSSYTLSLITLLVINQNVRAWPSCCKAVSLLCLVGGHPDRAGHSSSPLPVLVLHLTTLPSQGSPLPANCYSPAPGKSKGQLLVTRRDEGGAELLPTRPFNVKWGSDLLESFHYSSSLDSSSVLLGPSVTT